MSEERAGQSDAEGYHHGNLRAALLDAVGEIIAEKGIGGVSIREAARRAGVSHSAPAHHFGDKTGLITGYAERGFELFGDRLQEAADEHDEPGDKLSAIGLAYLRFSLEEPHYFELMFRSDLHDATPVLAECGRRAFGILRDVSAELAATDDSVENPELIAMSAWTGVHGMATLWRDGMIKEFWDGDDLLELAAAIFASNALPGTEQ